LTSHGTVPPVRLYSRHWYPVRWLRCETGTHFCHWLGSLNPISTFVNGQVLHVALGCWATKGLLLLLLLLLPLLVLVLVLP
jgi:hypothetical protein